MSFTETISPYIPELLGAVCFVLGYLVLNLFNKKGEPRILETDLPSLINDSIKEGYIERAILYLDQYSFISEHPNIKTFNLVLQSCCSLKHSERALAIFENMKNNSKLPKPTIETYEILIFTINETKKTNKVLEIIADIPLAQLANSELLQQISIECFVKQSRYEEAFEVFHKSEYKPSILPKFINSLLKTHYNEKAVELYFSYKNFLNTDEILIPILENASKYDNFKIMTEVFSDIQNPTVACYNSLIKAYTKSNNLPEVLNLLNLMTEKQIFIEENIFIVFVDFCVKLGKVSIALESYSLLKIENLKLSVAGFNSLIEACVKSSKMTDAWELLDEMKAQNCFPDNFTYSSLIKGIKTEGETADLDRAFDLLSALKQTNSVIPDEILYNCLLDACVSTKKFDKALELFHEMPKHDEISYNTLIKGFSQSKQIEKALEMLKSMKNSGISPNEVTYNSIIDTCVRCNQTTLA